MKTETQIERLAALKEKLKEKPASMSNAELLEIVLAPQLSTTAEEISHKVLFDCEGLNNLAMTPYRALESIEGVSKTAAATLFAYGCMCERLDLEACQAEILTSEDGAKFIQHFYGSRRDEVMLLICLDGKGCVLHIEKYQGKKNSVNMNYADAAYYVKQCKAHKVLLCHNHPSGNLTPSINDLDGTDQFVESLRKVNVSVLDHLLADGNGSVYSMFQEKLVLKELRKIVEPEF